MKNILLAISVCLFQSVNGQGEIQYWETLFNKSDKQIDSLVFKYGFGSYVLKSFTSPVDSGSYNGPKFNTQGRWIKNRNNNLTIDRTWDYAAIYNDANNDFIGYTPHLVKTLTLETTSQSQALAILNSAKQNQYKETFSKSNLEGIEKKYDAKYYQLVYKCRTVPSSRKVYLFILEEKKEKYRYTKKLLLE